MRDRRQGPRCNTQRVTGKPAHLVPERVEAVPSLESQYQNHAVRQLAVAEVLLARARDVEERPADDTWSDLVEGLQVEGGEEGEGGVERSAQEELGGSVGMFREKGGQEKELNMDLQIVGDL